MAENTKSYPKMSKESFRPVNHEDYLSAETISAPSLSFIQDAWRRLKKNKAAVVSLVILIIVAIIALLAPVLAPYDYAAQNAQFANLPPKIPGLEALSWFDGKTKVAGAAVDAYAKAGVPEGQYFYLGTDALGRDLLSRILYGTRVSLFIGVVAALLNLLIGVPYGIVSGWMGGKVDNLMQRILEVMSGVPNLVVVILLLLVLRPGISSIIISLALTEWITMARLVRAETLKIKTSEYVLAARSLGESPFKIALKHILPNIAGVVIIQTIFSIPSAIFFEAFLSFIGLGIPAPQASLGTLINDGYKTFRFLPHLMWYPAGVLCIVMISFNMLANGLRDALDPKTTD
ncbi:MULTISPECIES: oligopeptide ABC transporter permease [Aerococcus]|uniref:oligopeptide ABC transporter permease n=1 Tax=Aerococcus TaxID=1375 RepID=UPI000DCECCA5|nr:MULTISPECIES: oligopeptide ABC transporter permease [Aerococcus]KAA9300036.1 ABC transporter permease [Aerococcus tenax]MDK6687923.1 ABC transporter permease [Aerococcus urinae]MDK8132387.1 ABC transporter permease [Aerococcus urinae]MDL5178075.1 ABC transporter permease [Aerococcus tenax]MDL5207090.1 ABC transporter permease [Aerococcus tenax]